MNVKYVITFKIT